MNHTSSWILPLCNGARVYAAGRLTRVVPVAALPLAAGGLRRLQQLQVGSIQPFSSDQVALKSRPLLEFAPEVAVVPWNKQTEHEVFQFWTMRGVLVDEQLWQKPAQVTEQKALRAKLRRWGACCPNHRDVAFLEGYMEAWDTAAVAADSGVDVNKLALALRDFIRHRHDPGRVLRNLALVQGLFADAGMQYRLYRAATLALYSPQTLATRLPQLLELLQGILGADAAADLLDAQPGILARGHWQDMGSRIAALQQLHPGFDAGAAACRVGSLISMRPERLAAKWHGIQAAARLRDEEMVQLANYDPTILSVNLEVVQWKLALYHMYEQQRASRQQAAESQGPSTAASLQPRDRQLRFPSWLANVIKCGEARFQRLGYLLSIGDLGKRAYTVVREQDATFLLRHPDFMAYLRWPGPRALGAPSGSRGSTGGEGGLQPIDVLSDAEQPTV